jgi:hypothetical protein
MLVLTSKLELNKDVQQFNDQDEENYIRLEVLARAQSPQGR